MSGETTSAQCFDIEKRPDAGGRFCIAHTDTQQLAEANLRPGLARIPLFSTMTPGVDRLGATAAAIPHPAGGGARRQRGADGPGPRGGSGGRARGAARSPARAARGDPRSRGRQRGATAIQGRNARGQAHAIGPAGVSGAVDCEVVNATSAWCRGPWRVRAVTHRLAFIAPALSRSWCRLQESTVHGVRSAAQRGGQGGDGAAGRGKAGDRAAVAASWRRKVVGHSEDIWDTKGSDRKMAKIVVITSGKGGVGKTTTSASFSAGLALSGHKTAVIDFDVGLRNLDLIMGCERRVVYDLINVIQGEANLNQALIKDKQLDNLYILAASQTRDKDALTPEGSVEKILKNLGAMDFDYIVCDSPAGIESGALMAMHFADEALVVTNPEVSSVRDSDRILGMLSSKTKRAIEGSDPIKEHLLITRYNPNRVQDGQMLSLEDTRTFCASR
ncbi:hypothetical protein FQA39_LY19219 [Lamprigera yunnana]|nr:hypothetical protein FQA39_LY19219 [Lamprigera yunnana]